MMMMMMMSANDCPLSDDGVLRRRERTDVNGCLSNKRIVRHCSHFVRSFVLERAMIQRRELHRVATTTNQRCRSLHAIRIRQADHCGSMRSAVDNDEVERSRPGGRKRYPSSCFRRQDERVQPTAAPQTVLPCIEYECVRDGEQENTRPVNGETQPTAGRLPGPPPPVTPGSQSLSSCSARRFGTASYPLYPPLTLCKAPSLVCYSTNPPPQPADDHSPAPNGFPNTAAGRASLEMRPFSVAAAAVRGSTPIPWTLHHSIAGCLCLSDAGIARQVIVALAPGCLVSMVVFDTARTASFKHHSHVIRIGDNAMSPCNVTFYS